MSCIDSLSISSIVCNSSFMSACAAIFSALSAAALVLVTYFVYKWGCKDKEKENEMNHYFDYVVVYSLNVVDENRPKLEQLLNGLEILHSESSDTNCWRKKIDEIQAYYGEYKQKIFTRLCVFDVGLANKFNDFFEKKTDELTKTLQDFAFSAGSSGHLDCSQLLGYFENATIALKMRNFV